MDDDDAHPGAATVLTRHHHHRVIVVVIIIIRGGDCLNVGCVPSKVGVRDDVSHPDRASFTTAM